MHKLLEVFVPPKGSRKYTVAIAALVFGFVLALTGHMSGSEFVTNSGLVMGLFGGANAAVHIAGDKKDGPDQDS